MLAIRVLMSMGCTYRATPRYVYSYMAAITDPSRQRLLDVVRNDTQIPSERAFVHVSDKWHAQVFKVLSCQASSSFMNATLLNALNLPVARCEIAIDDAI